METSEKVEQMACRSCPPLFSRITDASAMIFTQESGLTLPLAHYDQTQILSADYALNTTAYEEYGRPYYTSTYQISLTTHNLSCGRQPAGISFESY